VGDYRPQTVASQKLQKTFPTSELTLVRNPDILSCWRETQTETQVLVGFAAEPKDCLKTPARNW